jgi:uncharacterized protein YceK
VGRRNLFSRAITARVLSLTLLLAAVLMFSGCASMDESADDQLNAYHSTPATPGDNHGWGASLEGAGK